MRELARKATKLRARPHSIQGSIKALKSNSPENPSSLPYFLPSWCPHTLRSDVHYQHSLFVFELLAQVEVLAAGILNGKIVQARPVREKEKSGKTR